MILILLLILIIIINVLTSIIVFIKPCDVNPSGIENMWLRLWVGCMTLSGFNLEFDYDVVSFTKLEDTLTCFPTKLVEMT